jgi:hypothetical protein
LNIAVSPGERMGAPRGRGERKRRLREGLYRLEVRLATSERGRTDFSECPGARDDLDEPEE